MDSGPRIVRNLTAHLTKTVLVRKKRAKEKAEKCGVRQTSGMNCWWSGIVLSGSTTAACIPDHLAAFSSNSQSQNDAQRIVVMGMDIEVPGSLGGGINEDAEDVEGHEN